MWDSTFGRFEEQSQSFKKVGIVSYPGTCRLCGKPFLSERQSKNLFLLPYSFSELRHFEREHEDIAESSRKVRLSATVSIHMGIIVLSGIIALRSLQQSEMSSSPPTQLLAGIHCSIRPSLA